MRYVLYCITWAAVLVGTAYADIHDLGGGQYVAVIQSDSSQTGPNWNSGVVTYIADAPETLSVPYPYTGRYDSLNYGRYEKYRNWHEFLLWEIPDNAIVDSAKLVITSFYLYGDSISIDVVNLNNGPRPSNQSPQDLWNNIGSAPVYVNDTKIYQNTYEPQWKLPGAEQIIQSRLGTTDEWFATGFRSNWEDRDSLLLDVYFVELLVYFRVAPDIHVDRPNGGEVFYIGSNDTIRWTASDYDNYVSYVDIFVSRDGGATYSWIGQKVNGYHLNPWQGSYIWDVTGPESDNCRIKIVAHDTDGLQNHDISDGDFSIQPLPLPEVTLLWPNASNIVVEEADTYQVRYNGDAVAGIKRVEAWFSYDRGQTWEDFINPHFYSSYPTHVENHTIDWPVTQHPTEHGRVKVVLYDAANQTAVDISSYDITVKLARPGNVTAAVSSNLESITLTWTDRSNYEDGYRIQRREPGGDWHNLATLQQNTTSYTDNSVAPFSDYEYRIWAFRTDGTTSDTVLLKTTTDGLVYSSASDDPVHKAPQIATNNGLIHMVFSHADTIFYSYTSDGGHTWSSPIIVGYGYHPSIASRGNYTAVVWDKDNYIYYRVKSGDEFLPATSFTPSGTRIEAYNPAVEIFADSAIVAFGANNDHYPFVLYKIFGVTNPPSGTVLCDTIWVYNHHLDSLGVKGIDGFGTGSDRYTVVTFWSYGYINTYAYDYEMHMYEKLPGSEFWQDGLGEHFDRYAQYISNPAVDSQNNKLYVAFSNEGSLEISVKNIGGDFVDCIYDTMSFYIARKGPLFMGTAGRVAAVSYIGPDDSTMGVFLISREPETVVTRELQLGFEGTMPAGLYLYRHLSYAKEDYHAVMSLNRTGYSVDGRYSKDSFIYQYNPTVSPLQREERVEPVRFAMRVAGIVDENGMLKLEMSIPEDGAVRLSVYDATGREVAHEHWNMGKGHHEVDFRLDVPSGVYFVKAEYGNKKLTRKFMVVR